MVPGAVVIPPYDLATVVDPKGLSGAGEGAGNVYRAEGAATI
jgi:hypothetical protein